MGPELFFKGVSEKFAVRLIYRSPDIESGESITSLTAVSYPTGLTLTTGFAGAVATVVVDGGSSGVEYLVQLEVQTSAGWKFKNPYKDAFLVRVI